MPAPAAALLTRSVADIEQPTLLDLGSGTGQVPLALHGVFAQVDIVEPNAGMVAEAKRLLPYLEGPGQTVRLHHAQAEHFTPPSETWRADLVTICRAFLGQPGHRPSPAGYLDRSAGHGRGHGRPKPVDPRQRMGQGPGMLIQEFLGDDRRAGPSDIFNPHNRPYADVLAESAFSDVQEYRFNVLLAYRP
ncbi:class I SAM-dependent methyltransferase [Streptomyces roseifaciens]